MQKLKNNLTFVFFGFLILIFFLPVFTKGYVPFPGDLLIAEYQPYRSYSINGMNPGAVPNKGQYFDTIRQIYPWKDFSVSEIKKGNLPLWNPHNFSGSPLFANFQSTVFYPTTVLYLIFSMPIAWTISIIIQPLLTLLATYCLARKVGISKFGSIISSISYSFSLFMTTFLEYNTISHFMYLLPTAVISTEWFFEKRKGAGPLISLVIALSFFAGHLQLAGGIVVYLLIYAFIRNLKKNSGIRELLKLIAFIALGVLAASIQLVPGLELLFNSSRESHPPNFFINNLLIKPEQLILYLVPDLFGNPAVKNYLLPYSYPSKAIYVGVAAAILFMFSLLGKRNRITNSILISSCVFALIVFLTPVSYVLYQINVPILSTSSPSNFIFLVSLGICIGAGVGFDSIEKFSFKKVIITLCTFPAVLIVTFLLVNFLNIQIIRNSLIFSSGIVFIIVFSILLTRYKRARLLGYTLLIVIMTAELLYFFNKFNPFVPTSFLYPTTGVEEWLVKNSGIDRHWGFSHASIQPNFQTGMRTYSVEGYDPLYPKVYHDFIKIGGSNTTRSDALITNGFGNSNFSDNSNRLTILKATGTSIILDKKENGSTEETFPSQSFTKDAEVDDFIVMRVKNTTPRIFITRKYIIYKGFDDFKRKLLGKQYANDVLLLDQVPKLSQKPLTVKNLQLISYDSQTVRIEAQTDSDSMLFMSDTYYPGWKAFVNGKKTEIIRANYAFRSIILPPGDSIVEFKYEPNSFYYGLLISIASIISIGIIWQKLKY